VASRFKIACATSVARQDRWHRASDQVFVTDGDQLCRPVGFLVKSFFASSNSSTSSFVSRGSDFARSTGGKQTHLLGFLRPRVGEHFLGKHSGRFHKLRVVQEHKSLLRGSGRASLENANLARGASNVVMFAMGAVRFQRCRGCAVEIIVDALVIARLISLLSATNRPVGMD